MQSSVTTHAVEDNTRELAGPVWAQILAPDSSGLNQGVRLFAVYPHVRDAFASGVLQVDPGAHRASIRVCHLA